MVVIIEPPHKNVGNTVSYNEKKAKEGEENARVIGFSKGISSIEEFNRRIEILSRGNLRTRNEAFHAHINPGPGENLSDEKAMEMATELMERLGYGNQPFVVYRHDDTGRTHYHIVSSRVGPDGKRINSDYEWRRCNQHVRDMAAKYGYTVDGRRAKEKTDNREYVRFNRNEKDIKGQIENLLRLSLQYNCSTMDEYLAVLRSMGLMMYGTSGKSFLVKGLYRGKPCTAAFSSEDVGIDDLEKIFKESYKKGKRDRAEERLKNIASSGLDHSSSYKHFRNMLRKQGIDIYVTRDSSGRFSSVIYVDHTTRCCYSGDRLGSEYSADMLNVMESSGLWEKHQEAVATENIYRTNYADDILKSVAAILEGGYNLEKDDRFNDENKKKNRIKRRR